MTIERSRFTWKIHSVASQQASSELDGLLSATRAIATVLLLLLLLLFLFVVASFSVFVMFWEFFGDYVGHKGFALWLCLLFDASKWAAFSFLGLFVWFGDGTVGFWVGVPCL